MMKMSKKYNGETVILPKSISGKSIEVSEKGFLFAFHDGKVEKYRLDGVKRLGRMTDGNIPDIVVQNMFLSRSHGYFTAEDGYVTYTAEETTNGIALNGKTIPPGTTVRLFDGDELTIPTVENADSKNDIILKCAFSPSKISLWDSMIKAQLDELTGLPGRRLFTDRFEALPRTDDTDDWLFILDVDRFKQINDKYGHSVGDDTLKTLADELKKPEHHIRLSARWGGDEFVGVVSGDKESVLFIINKLVDALSSRMIRNRFSIFVSMGICRIPRISGGNLLTETVEKADKALYQAKRNENEQVCFYEQR